MNKIEENCYPLFLLISERQKVSGNLNNSPLLIILLVSWNELNIKEKEVRVKSRKNQLIWKSLKIWEFKYLINNWIKRDLWLSLIKIAQLRLFSSLQRLNKKERIFLNPKKLIKKRFLFLSINNKKYKFSEIY